MISVSISRCRSQYVIWIEQSFFAAISADPYILHKPVLDEVLERLFPTLLLAGTALVLWRASSAVLLGIVAAVRQNAWQDKLITVAVLIGISTPSFWLGILLIFWFGVRLAWLPVGGMVEMFGGGGAIDIARHLVLPAVRAGGGRRRGAGAPDPRRHARGDAPGLYPHGPRQGPRAKASVIIGHAFRNALVDIIPIIGLEAGFVLGGAVYIETVFQWPGIGRMLVSAISTRDILLVQGGVLIVAVAYVAINLLTDIVAEHARSADRRS